MSDISDADDLLNPARKRRRLDKGKGKVVIADSEDEDESNKAPSRPASTLTGGQPDNRHNAVQAVARGATDSEASTPMSTYTRTATRPANDAPIAQERTKKATTAAEDDLSDEEAGGRKGRNQANKWETFQRSWEAVTEDETGGLQGAVDRLLAKARRRRRVQKKKTAWRSGANGNLGRSQSGNFSIVSSPIHHPTYVHIIRPFVVNVRNRFETKSVSCSTRLLW
jgi:hypothetical protein